jgi:hypothetical protein
MSRLPLGFLSGFIHWGFPIKILYKIFISYIPRKCLAHLIILYFITLMICHEYNYWAPHTIFSIRLLYLIFYNFSGVGWDWVHLVRRPLFGPLYQPRMIDDECGVVGRMRTGRGNRSTLRKPAPVPLCPPQIPHNLTWDRTRAAAMGSRRLTAWPMARPPFSCYFLCLRSRSSLQYSVLKHPQSPLLF